MTETQLPDFPTATYLRVVCRLGLIAPDAEDPADAPDWRTQGGTVTLTPGAPQVRVVEADGKSRVITVPTVTAQIVPATGELMGPTGVIGVQVLNPASAIDPSGWQWTATVTPTTGPAIPPVVFDNTVAVGGVIDLAAGTDLPSAAAVAGLTARVTALESGGGATPPFPNARVKVDPSAYQYARRSPVKLTIPTPDATGQAVHPSVIFFPDGYHGYRYWLAVTPYTNSDNQQENPCVYGSQDGITWDVPAGVTNPLVAAPGAGGYNSDTDLVVGADGRFHIYFRTNAGPTETVRLISSSDGRTWTLPVDLFTLASATETALSPSVWREASGEWVMLAVNIVPVGRTITRRTSPAPEGPWSAPTTTTWAPAMPAGRMPWHVGAISVGGQVIATMQDNAVDGGVGLLYLATSDDAGKTFRRAPSPLIDEANKYRASLVPLLDASGVQFELFVSQNEAGAWWTYRVQTAHKVDRVADHAREVIAAQVRSYPYLAGDAFDRADSSGLGAAPSGQVWEAGAGTFNIVSATARASAATNTRALIQTTSTDMDVSISVTSAASSQAWMIFRAIDGSNYWRFGFLSSSTIRWEKVGGGGGSGATLDSFVGRHILRVVAVGSLIRMFLDGEVVFEVMDSTHATGTKVGIQTDGTAVVFDGIAARVPSA